MLKTGITTTLYGEGYQYNITVDNAILALEFYENGAHAGEITFESLEEMKQVALMLLRAANLGEEFTK